MAGDQGSCLAQHFSLKRGSQSQLASSHWGALSTYRWMPGLHPRPPTSESLGVWWGCQGPDDPAAWSGWKHPCLTEFQLTTLASENSSHTKDHIKGGPQRMVFPLLIMTQPKHFSPAPFTCLRVLRKVNLFICQYLLCLLPSMEEGKTGKTVFTVKLVFIQRICKLSQSYGKSITLS